MPASSETDGESHGSAGDEDGSAGGKRRSHWINGPMWLGATALVALIGLGVGRAVDLIGAVVDPKPPGYDAQIRAIEKRITRSQARVIALRPVAFHGPGEPSYLLVFRYRKLDDEKDPSPSDGVRIYDPSPSGRLRLALDLRVPPTDYEQGRLVALLDIGDYAKSGFPEALLTVSDLGPGGAVYPRPVLVSWRPERDRYEVDALVNAAPKVRGTGMYGRPAARRYRTPTTLVDHVTRSRIRTYPAGDQIAVRILQGEPFIAGAYVTRAHFANVFHELVLEINGLDFSYHRPYEQTCVREQVRHVVYAQADLQSLLSAEIVRHRRLLTGGCLY